MASSAELQSLATSKAVAKLGRQALSRSIWWFPKIGGTFFGAPNNKDYSILGSILGSPILRNYHIISRARSGIEL